MQTIKGCIFRGGCSLFAMWLGLWMLAEGLKYFVKTAVLVAGGGASIAEVEHKPKTGGVTIFGAEGKFRSHIVKIRWLLPAPQPRFAFRNATVLLQARSAAALS